MKPDRWLSAIAQALVGLIGALRQSCGDNLSGTTKTKRTTGATDGPKSFEGFCRVVPVDCTQTGLLPAGLMLALRWPLDPDLWTLAFGQWSRRTLVAISAGHIGSRRFRSGWCEKPVRSTTDNSTADPIQRMVQTIIIRSSMKFKSARLSIHPPNAAKPHTQIAIRGDRWSDDVLFGSQTWSRVSSGNPAARKVPTSGRTLNGTRLQKPAVPFRHNAGGCRGWS